MKNKKSLNGCLIIIAGIIFMLFPINIFWEHIGEIFDIVGFFLMTVGLVSLLHEGHDFKISALFSAISTVLSIIVLIFEPGHIFAVLPLVSYCFVLYFMCTRFEKIADSCGEHSMAHHFISHMWVDIVATTVELTAHLLGIHGIIFYAILAADLYCETQLIIHIMNFYKKYNSVSDHKIA